MKRTIILLAMMLVFTNISFASDLDGVRGSKWGASPLTVKDNENIQGGRFSTEVVHNNDTYELQYNFDGSRGPAYSWYIFKKKRLINGGIILTMDEYSWEIYYHEYNQLKIYIEKTLGVSPKFNSCNEIEVLNDTIQDCKTRISMMPEQIATKEVSLYNSFNADKTYLEILLFGLNDYKSNIIIHLKAK